MQQVTLASADDLTTQMGYAYRLASGQVHVLGSTNLASLLLSNSWGCLLWNDTSTAMPVVIRAAEDAVVERHAIADLLPDPAEYCHTLANGYEHYLQLRLNLFGYEAHVQQVLQHYGEQYLIMADDIARDLQQRELQTLPQNIACQQELQTDRETVARLIASNKSTGRLTLYNQEQRAAAGLYLVTQGTFALQLGHRDVLCFQLDQLVYLPARVFALPGYRTHNAGNLLRVGSDFNDLLQRLQHSAKVPQRFLIQYGSMTNALLRQCQDSIQTAREVRGRLCSCEGSLHSLFVKIAKHAVTEPALSSYAEQAAALGDNCRVAQDKLCAEEELLFRV